ncbi:thymidine kinase [uncultured Dysosmobacter sp.]|uniref:thymidine kinase n=1 Tax=uncultured Dysosmobacter sp. TaxID=2591384 RepID=UPI00261C2B46|nr:thymidine kinase [uncultured Dysosmobacter sp.]
MAQLYFKYGAMGSSKTANALMARFNYEERGQRVLLAKPQLDTRDGDHMVRSRIGLTYPCVYFHEMQAMDDAELQTYNCIIVDEAQFLAREEVQYLVHLVDDCNIPVICYGLRSDFKGELFPGNYELLAMADKIEEVKTICWCGKKATFNARFDENSVVLKEGAQVVIGANDQYIGLCRKHWREGNLGPDFHPVAKIGDDRFLC